MSGPLRPFAATIAEHTDGDLFHRHVLRWCMENFVPVRLLAPGLVCVVFYEDLVEDPGRELARLSTFLHRYTAGRWALATDLPSALDRPSRTNYRDTPLMTAPDRLASWLGDVPVERLRSAMAIVGAFGLDTVYGMGPKPLVAPDALWPGDVRTA
jgi:hypothetical protein